LEAILQRHRSYKVKYSHWIYPTLKYKYIYKRFIRYVLLCLYSGSWHAFGLCAPAHL
jgi:hypothetical protein